MAEDSLLVELQMNPLYHWYHWIHMHLHTELHTELHTPVSMKPFRTWLRTASWCGAAGKLAASLFPHVFMPNFTLEPTHVCTCIIFQDMAEDSVLVELQMNCDVVLFGSQVRLRAGLVHA